MAAKPANQVGVFISYSHEDRFIAEMLAQRLREVGYLPWVDFAGISGGDEWKQSIDEAMSRSSAFLLLLTPDSVKSHWVSFEISCAREKNCPIIPLLFRACETPEDIAKLHFVEFRHSADSGFKELQKALLQAVVRGGSGVEEETTKPKLPVRNALPEEPVYADQASPLALVIEDAPSYQDLLRDLLMEMGLEVHVAKSRNEATAYIQAHRYDFITLDMNLGPDDENGQQGMYVLGLLERYQTDVPVVMVTNVEFNRDETAEFIASGAVKHVLGKPLIAKKLREQVEKYVHGVRR